jgi:hypothetical protein
LTRKFQVVLAMLEQLEKKKKKKEFQLYRPEPEQIAVILFYFFFIKNLGSIYTESEMICEYLKLSNQEKKEKSRTNCSKLLLETKYQYHNNSVHDHKLDNPS